MVFITASRGVQKSGLPCNFIGGISAVFNTDMSRKIKNTTKKQGPKSNNKDEIIAQQDYPKRQQHREIFFTSRMILHHISNLDSEPAHYNIDWEIFFLLNL
jgi:hypothetical protein